MRLIFEDVEPNKGYFCLIYIHGVGVRSVRVSATVRVWGFDI